MEIELLEKVPAAAAEGPTLYDTLREFVGCIKDGPEDLAAEHDHYAHGAPKREAL